MEHRWAACTGNGGLNAVWHTHRATAPGHVAHPRRLGGRSAAVPRVLGALIALLTFALLSASPFAPPADAMRAPDRPAVVTLSADTSLGASTIDDADAAADAVVSGRRSWG